jgi:tRNA nucleotidyltransferase/poly(A) polymerase
MRNATPGARKQIGIAPRYAPCDLAHAPPGAHTLGMQLAVPPPVLALCAALRRAGHEAALVGGCVRDALLARPVRDWDIATSAPVEAILALFPRAIPIGASARHGTALVPSEAGPVDVTTFRGPDLAADLARRDFTINAMAWRDDEKRLVDPHGGQRDLAASRLRAVGSASERFDEDPLRALRAARLFSELGLAPDADVEAAMRGHAGAVRSLAPERVRSELTRTLLGPHAQGALALLRRTGLEAELVPGARDDCAAVLAALPPDLTLRLAAWLRGAVRGRVLARLRFGKVVARRVDRLLSLHPIEAGWDGSARGVRRIRQRAGDEPTLEALLALRAAECSAAGDSAAGERLVALRAELAAAPAKTFGPADLALRGDEVVAALATRPGPRVGRALAHLVDHVIADPAANTPERLRELLAEWGQANPE